jgi:hypothetical protein
MRRRHSDSRGGWQGRVVDTMESSVKAIMASRVEEVKRVEFRNLHLLDPDRCRKGVEPYVDVKRQDTHN